MSSPAKALSRQLSGGLSASMTGIVEIIHSGYLKYSAKIDGESTGAPAKRFFAITPGGQLLHAESQKLVRLPLLATAAHLWYHLLLRGYAKIASEGSSRQSFAPQIWERATAPLEWFFASELHASGILSWPTTY